MKPMNTTETATTPLGKWACKDASFLVLCFLVGLLAGTAAFILKRLTAFISHMVTSGLTPEQIPWRFLWLPVAGIILAGLFQRYIVRRPLDHGTDRINYALRSRNYYLPQSTVFSPIIGASLTLGFGGSAGLEGPVAYASSAIGSSVGRFFHVPYQMVSVLVAIGGAAGIAGIFKSPMGGLFFALEVLLVQASAKNVVRLAVACITAGMTAFALSGFTHDIELRTIPDFNPQLLLWAIPVGIVCGFYSAYYSGLMAHITALFHKIRHPFAKWIIAGCSISVMVFSLPSLFGEGYQVVADILNGTGADALTFGSVLGKIKGMSPMIMLLIITAMVALLKSPASAATNDGGGVAGDFAPTIFAGAIVGFFLATVATTVLGFNVSVPAMVFMAMGGVMAGAVRAPLMAMFIVAESTGAYSLFLPLAITSAISFVIVWVLTLRTGRNAR